MLVDEEEVKELRIRERHGHEGGAPPTVDLNDELFGGWIVRCLIEEGIANAVHDLSDGGLAVAAA